MSKLFMRILRPVCIFLNVQSLKIVLRLLKCDCARIKKAVIYNRNRNRQSDNRITANINTWNWVHVYEERY